MKGKFNSDSRLWEALGAYAGVLWCLRFSTFVGARHQDCAQAVEKGEATKESENRFRTAGQLAATKETEGPTQIFRKTLIAE